MRGVARRGRDAAAPLAVAVAALLALGVRVRSEGVTLSPDGWAYTIWGRQLARRFQSPAYDLLHTSPKPLTTIIGALVAYLPPGRGFQLVVVIAVASTLGLAYALAARGGGWWAAAAALVVALASMQLAEPLFWGVADTIAAALLAGALVARGRGRVACLAVLALLRPEGWVVAAAAAFLARPGRLVARVGRAVLAGLAGLALWMSADLLIDGDPTLLFSHAETIDSSGRYGHVRLRALPDAIWHAARHELGLPLVLIGAAGLLLLGFEARRRRLDLLPAASVLLWPLVVAVEVHGGFPPEPRFLLPLVAPLALGVAVVCGRLVGTRADALRPLLGLALPTLVVILAVIVAAVRITPDPSAVAYRLRDREAVRSVPVVRAALRCGTVEIASRLPGWDMGLLASLGDLDVRRFQRPEQTDVPGAVLVYGRGERGWLPQGWPVRRIAMGLLATRPGCAI